MKYFRLLAIESLTILLLLNCQNPSSNNAPINENIPVDSVIISKTSIEIMTGGTFQLQANCLPNEASNTDLTWTSSNEIVVSVSQDGKITGLTEGSSQITATSSNGKKGTCNVIVRSPIGGSTDFILKGQWNYGFNELIGRNLEFTNSSIIVQADYPDIIYSYDNENSTAILFWSDKATFQKISWIKTNSGYKVTHYSEVASINDINKSTPQLEFFLLQKDTNAPSIFSSTPSQNATGISSSTQYIDITFNQVMNTIYLSCLSTGGTVDSTIAPIWSHDFENGRSTLRLYFRTPLPSNVTITLNPTGYVNMRDIDDNYLLENTQISFSTQ